MPSFPDGLRITLAPGERVTRVDAAGHVVWDCDEQGNVRSVGERRNDLAAIPVADPGPPPQDEPY